MDIQTISRPLRRLAGAVTLAAVQAALVPGAAAQPAPPAELLAYPTLILYNGKVLTVDAVGTKVRAESVPDMMPGRARRRPGGAVLTPFGRTIAVAPHFL